MIDQSIINFITQVGFPIAMVFYMMFRFEKKLDENTKAMNKLHDYIKTKR